MTIGSCFFGFGKKKKNANKEITLAIFGIDNAGKTTTTKCIRGDSLEVCPTMGFDLIEFSLDSYNVSMYDIGGSGSLRSIWNNYFSEIHGLVYVVDSCDVQRLDETRATLAGLLQNELIQGKPVLLLANKQDSVEAMDEAEIVSSLRLSELACANRCPCRLERSVANIGTGAKMDRGIKTGLRWLLQYVSLNWAQLNARVALDKAAKATADAAEAAARKERVRRRREEREKLEAAETAAAGEASGDKKSSSSLKLHEANDGAEDAGADEASTSSPSRRSRRRLEDAAVADAGGEDDDWRQPRSRRPRQLADIGGGDVADAAGNGEKSSSTKSAKASSKARSKLQEADGEEAAAAVDAASSLSRPSRRRLADADVADGADENLPQRRDRRPRDRRRSGGEGDADGDGEKEATSSERSRRSSSSRRRREDGDGDADSVDLADARPSRKSASPGKTGRRHRRLAPLDGEGEGVGDGEAPSTRATPAALFEIGGGGGGGGGGGAGDGKLSHLPPLRRAQPNTSDQDYAT